MTNRTELSEQEELPTCGNCGFPNTSDQVAPATVEEALTMGWTETEFGVLCSACSADTSSIVDVNEAGVDAGDFVKQALLLRLEGVFPTVKESQREAAVDYYLSLARWAARQKLPEFAKVSSDHPTPQPPKGISGLRLKRMLEVLNNTQMTTSKPEAEVKE